ncbi:GIY-YIG nuclease family protein [uncultured Brachyspira sp.]|uniref:GIY-YIG nuclease family protein n=1 Tax=uncultured Brachyspira sp. TaxID=221953 RepID=UPI0026086F93|nr:GIY-YIG nuclease family protein [uncultured Brachyspira sp.]
MSIYNSGRPKKYNPAIKKGKIPPCEAGEYRIRDDEKNIDYIGETNNLKRRMQEHIRSGKLKINYTFEYQIADESSTSQTRREHEKEKIEQHKPALNKSKGGEGRPANKKKSN